MEIAQYQISKSHGAAATCYNLLFSCHCKTQMQYHLQTGCLEKHGTIVGAG